MSDVFIYTIIKVFLKYLSRFAPNKGYSASNKNIKNNTVKMLTMATQDIIYKYMKLSKIIIFSQHFKQRLRLETEQNINDHSLSKKM